MNNQINNYIALGTMSGSSLDGLDIAAVEFNQTNDKIIHVVLATSCFRYPTEWEVRLAAVRDLSAIDLLKTSIDYAKWNATCISNFIKTNELKQLGLVVSHGHTVYHQPSQGFTLQIGDGQTLATTLQLPVVANLRAKDVAHGGQGAPIVPIADRLLFAEYAACLNLGGIANITFKQGAFYKAYDICAANQVLNFIANKAGKAYDDSGIIARSGSMLPSVLNDFVKLEYHHRLAPKSLANEWIYEYIIQKINTTQYTVPDLLHTFTNAIATLIAREINENINNEERVLATGGGAFNTYLIECLQAKTTRRIVVPDATTINYKEAIAMALIGTMRWHGQANVLASATGARSDTTCGDIYLP